MNPERFRTAVFLGILGAALAVCFALVFPFLRLLGWAVVLAVVAYPIQRLLGRVITDPSVAAGLSCFLLIVAGVVPASFLALQVAEEATLVMRDLQVSVGRGKLTGRLDPAKIPAVQRTLDWLQQRLNLKPLNPEQIVHDTIKKASTKLGQESMKVVRNAAWFAVQVGLTFVTLFFFLRDGPKLLPAVRDFIPLDDRQTAAVLRRAADTLHATVYGATVVAVLQGVLTGTAFWVLGLPSPLFWGAVTTALCFVPLLGAPAVWVPAAIWLAVQGVYWKAVVLALTGVLVIGLVDNFVRPLVIGARTQLHTLVVFLSVMGGLLLIGPLGLLLGPVILSVTLALLDILRLKLKEGERLLFEAECCAPVQVSAAPAPGGESASEPQRGPGVDGASTEAEEPETRGDTGE